MKCRRLVLLCAGVLTICLAENKETTDQDDGHDKEGDSFFSTCHESHAHTCRKPGNCEVLYDSRLVISVVLEVAWLKQQYKSKSNEVNVLRLSAQRL